MTDANAHMDYSEQEILEHYEAERERANGSYWDEDNTCPVCDGAGRVQTPNLWEVDYMVCPECDGAGEV